ncbi:hypothetical protein, partial [Paenarthrobacter sp. PH39-S1]|uniref:hypothetical protein n=1 Tax=Paenarthrobacter sp. PH39-S1 TaxID=3046204 RepID=UPI0024BB4B48
GPVVSLTPPTKNVKDQTKKPRKIRPVVRQRDHPRSSTATRNTLTRRHGETVFVMDVFFSKPAAQNVRKRLQGVSVSGWGTLSGAQGTGRHRD